jgi:hypothetical protein
MFGGMQIDASAYAICVHPSAPGLQRRGTLALIGEPVGSVALEADACRLAQRTVVEGYFSDHSLGLTSSLLNALDGANNALLQYGAGWPPSDGAGDSGEGGGVALQSVKTKRVRVGMTALLLRPDGTGVYLSQMAPTQAYILHNGLLSALPEPAGWTPAPGRTVISLKRVLAEEGDEAEDDEALEISNVTVPAPPLGSGPGIEADLIYRRVQPGDKIVLVSSGLARHIERQWAEDAFTYDTDSIVGALADLAREHGLAEAHACVLELGVDVASGVDTDYTLPVAPKASLQVAQEGGASAAPQGPQKPGPGAGLIEALRGPREWLSRRKHEAEVTSGALEVEQSSPAEVEKWLEMDKPLWEDREPNGNVPEPATEPDDEDEAEVWSRQPTQLFVQRTPEVPPYQAGAAATVSASSEAAEELQFDGWEDAPPALDDPRYGSTHRVIFKPKVAHETEAGDLFAEAYGIDGANALERSYAAVDSPLEGDVLTPAAKGQGFNLGASAQNVAAWAGRAIAGIMPQRMGGPPLAGRRDATRGMVLPLRVVILAALAVAGLVLIVSLISMRGSAEQAITNNLLAEAQQLQMAANQPGLTEVERIAKLQLALDKAQEAAADDPQSEEARRLVGKLTTDLDTAQGVTRLASLKVLFDLDAIDGTAGAATQPGQEAGANEVPASNIDNDVIAQGNDVYVLDRGRSRVYRCQVAAKSCSVVLSAGDTIGGQKVGAPAAITLRVGSPVVLDENLVSYIFSADTGAWLAEPLGGKDGLQKPAGIASYDGNLYLLGAKAGQISKYPSGQFGQPPIDWITDGPTTEAMKQPAGIAIDGVIYVALADGKVLVMQGGKLTGTFTTRSTSDMGAPTGLFTNTDIRDLYVLRSGEGSVTRLNKEGQTLGIYKAPTDAGLTGFSGFSVDEGRGKIYLSVNRKVYEATLSAPGAKTTPAMQAPLSTQLQQEVPPPVDNPSVKPTVVP